MNKLIPREFVIFFLSCFLIYLVFYLYEKGEKKIMEIIKPVKNHSVIQHYNPETEKLERAQIVKIKKLIQYDCFRKVERTSWFVCLPIPEYNFNCYLLKPIDDDGNYSCNCQGYTKKKYCSHSDALKLVKDHGQVEFAF